MATTNDDLDHMIRAGASDYGDEDDIDTTPETAPEPVTEPAPEPTPEVEPAPEPVVEAEPAPESESEASSVSTAEPQNKKPNIRIPKERFDEVNERRKAAEARLREFEEQAAAAQKGAEGQFDFDTKEREYMEAVLDGKTTDALAIRKEIRAAEHAAAAQIAETASARAREATKTDIKMQSVIEDLHARYEPFDPDSDGYDQDLTEEALAMQRAFTSQGLTPETALRKAVQYVVKANGIADRLGAAEPVEDTGLGKQTPTPTPQQVKDKLDVATRQPPTTPSRTKEEPQVDVLSMSDEEFDNLSEAALRKLRGDFR